MQAADNARLSTTMRVIHGAFVAGVVLFAIVVYAIVRPQWTSEPLPRVAVTTLLGVSLAASALSLLFLRARVPRRSTDESADLFWTRASVPALIAWAALEGAALLGIINYLLNGSTAALGTAAIALFGLIALYPGQFERT